MNVWVNVGESYHLNLAAFLQVVQHSRDHSRFTKKKKVLVDSTLRLNVLMSVFCLVNQ